MPYKPETVKSTHAPSTVAPRETVARKIRRTTRWKRLAIAVLKRDPVCCDPLRLHQGVVVATTQAHHIIPIEERPDLAYTPWNVKGLCVSCHSAVEQLERRGDTGSRLVFARNAKELAQELVKIGVTFEGEGCEKPLGPKDQATDAAIFSSLRQPVEPGAKVEARHDTPVPSAVKTKVCHRYSTNNVFCARMRKNRSTPCAGCNHL